MEEDIEDNQELIKALEELIKNLIPVDGDKKVEVMVSYKEANPPED